MEDVPNLPGQNKEDSLNNKPEPIQNPADESKPTSSLENTPSSTGNPGNLNQVMSENSKADSVISYNKKKSFLDYFIYAIAVIAFLVWMAVLALFIQNREADNVEESQPLVPKETITTVPEQKQYNVSSKNGNIVNVTSEGAEEILINKDDYTETGISGFIKVSVSPDKERICFESWPPSTDPALYLANIDGTDVVKVNSNRRNCIWSPDGKSIAYNDVRSEKEGSDLYVYNLLESMEELITIHTATESAKPKLHTAKNWSPDGKIIVCEYSYIKTPSKVMQCEAEIDSNFVNYF